MNEHAMASTPADAARSLADRFWERAAEHDASGRFPFANFEELRKAGLLKANVPLELGGGGLGPETQRPLELWEITRAVAYGDPSTAQPFHVHANEIDIILGLGTPEQHARFLRPVVERGAVLGGYGSQLADSTPTLATRTRSGWLLKGTKYFCTNSEAAEHALVWAIIDGPGEPGDRIQVFYIRHDMPGVRIKRGWWENFQAMRSTASHVVELDDVELDDTFALGKPGDYLKLGLQARAYCQFAASFIGIADRLLSVSLDSVAKRKLGDDPVAIARIGSSRVHIDAAWGLVQRAAEAYTAGNADAPVKANIARYFAEHALRHIWEATLDNVGTYAGHAASGLTKLSRDIALYIRHESRDRILGTIGQAERGVAHDVSFSGENPILKGIGKP